MINYIIRATPVTAAAAAAAEPVFSGVVNVEVGVVVCVERIAPASDKLGDTGR